MARRLVSIDRETPLLLPPSIQDWVPQGDISRFILDAVAVTGDDACHFNWRGSGSAQYPPLMMLALLIYCYAHGIFSSRRIERATWRDIGARYITGDTHPDHDTIAAFRRDNGTLLKACFVEVLGLARATGVKRIGEVAIDGTKLGASAGKRRVMTREEIEKELGGLEATVEARLEQAELADLGDRREDELPAPLTDAGKRREVLLRAKAELEARALRIHEERKRERDDHDDEGPGEPPKLPPAGAAAKDPVNLTDPDARLMPCKQGGFAPGYNAQIAVQADPAAPLILAASVCDETNDRRQLLPVAGRTLALNPDTTSILVDSGYDHSPQIYRIERDHRVVVHCPPEKRKPREAGQAGEGEALAKPPRESKARQLTRRYREAMSAGMRTSFGRTSRQLRATTVEPVFGWIKKTLGFGRFHLRGLPKVNLEWDLVCLAFNLRLLHRKTTA